MQLKKIASMFIFTLSVILIMSACSNSKTDTEGKEQQEEEQEVFEDVTLTANFLNISEENFQRWVAGPVKEAYPHITLVNVEGNAINNLEQRIVNQDVPDLLEFTMGALSGVLRFQMLEDLNPFIRGRNFDLNALNPAAVDAVNRVNANQFLMMPIALDDQAVFYNPDVFDIFGAPHPVDGMTWPEIIDLARRTTGERDGVKYRGLSLELSYAFEINALSAGYVNPDTLKGTLDTDLWRKYFEAVLPIHRIPGNEITSNAEYRQHMDHFYRDRNVGMIPRASGMASWFAELTDFNWDVVTYPSFPDNPGRVAQISPHLLGMTVTSQHKDDVFRAMEVLLSEDVQQDRARAGKISVLNNPAANEFLFADNELWQGKNISALYQVDYSPRRPITAYDGNVRNFLVAAFNEVLITGKDVNTALREAQEKADQFLTAELAK